MKITLEIPGITERNEAPRLYAHTNNVDAALPHESLTARINELEKRLNEIYRLADDGKAWADKLGHDEKSGQIKSKFHKISVLSDLTRLDIFIV